MLESLNGIGNKPFVNPVHLDALAGAIAAIEGIRDAVAVLHGPSGCKYGVAVLVDTQDPDGLELPLTSGLRLGGQGRVPCTNLTQHDAIFGANEKLQSTLRQLLTEYQPNLIGVVNACLVMLIGDDTDAAAQMINTETPIVVIEGGRIVGDVTTGFARTLRTLVDTLPWRDSDCPGPTINLVGPCITQYNWQDDLSELQRLLRRIGIPDVSTLTAGSTFSQILKAPHATLNVVTHDDYGTSTAELLAQTFGTPAVGSELLAPYGLENTTHWLRAVGNTLGLDVEPIVDAETRHVERRLIPQLKRLTRRCSLKGVPFALFAEAPVCLGIASWLESYLGLEPVLLGLKTVGPNTATHVEELRANSHYTPQVLWQPHGLEIQQALQEAQPQLMLASTLERALAQTASVSCKFVGLSYPVVDTVRLTERPFMGYRGVLTLAEEVIQAICFDVSVE